MLIEAVLNAAQPYLQDRKVRDAVVGISLIAVELDDDNVGVSYVLREDLKAGCSIFPYVQDIIGRDAVDIAQWSISGGDNLQKGIGIAVLCAASASQHLDDCETPERPFGVNARETDTVGMIGYIAPVVNLLGPRVNKLYVFDKGISQIGGSNSDVFPIEEQPSLLPTCDIVVLSGTTMINGTIDDLLKLCEQAREIVMIGASTPMFPAAFLATRVTVLAGSWWKSEHKKEIFQKISLAGGMRMLSPYAIKKTVPVHA
ncbi:hypothetical protein SPSYN_00399 [Sporotomaculum syntrophicum]|uniref:Heavy-metal chelation domain-containing protein n=1 Tax=Sporotomaculum syntrophicum TaxID=182264 RepID=A0A9D3AXG3_9FIRM|nr:DUF364 domain-containing protein [Sporotomaculum syntrophicum]KAF1086680.1 hypothetical protein SPSYN_00399 [Sporotomaculum syntrophicum]